MGYHLRFTCCGGKVPQKGHATGPKQPAAGMSSGAGVVQKYLGYRLLNRSWPVVRSVNGAELGEL